MKIGGSMVQKAKEETAHEVRLKTISMLNGLIGEAKNRQSKKRRDGRICCANQLRLFATYMEGELKKWHW